MPRKIRELKADLRRAGFVEEPGKGSHTGWRHPRLADKLTLAGQDGDDAHAYQEKQVRVVIHQAREAERSQDA